MRPACPAAAAHACLRTPAHSSSSLAADSRLWCNRCCCYHRYGLTPEQQREVEAAYTELLAQASAAAAAQQPPAAAAEALPPDLDILRCDVAALHTRQKQLMLVALHARLAQLAAAAVQQQPQLASLLTYQQQQPAGWIAQGLAAAGAAEQGDANDTK